jgi:phosphoribosylformylglycinamidine (FGAM) synthase PurS component
MTYQVICSSIGRVFTIQIEAQSVEQATEKVKALAKQQGVKHLHISAVIQLF